MVTLGRTVRAMGAAVAIALAAALAPSAEARTADMDALRSTAAEAAAGMFRVEARSSSREVLILMVPLSGGQEASVQVSIDDDGRHVWFDLQLTDDPHADIGMSAEGLLRLQGRLAPVFASADDFGIWLSLPLVNRRLQASDIRTAVGLLSEKADLFLSGGRRDLASVRPPAGR
jgi:hypothetical protein